MPGLLLNIDVPDLPAGEAFYRAAFGLEVGRRFGQDAVELVGFEAPLYLLRKDEGSPIGLGQVETRRYRRHWCPIHPDIVVADLALATGRVLAAGAVLEEEARDTPWGRIAMFADPFGHGFCLIQFSAEGYDAIAD